MHGDVCGAGMTRQGCGALFNGSPVESLHYGQVAGASSMLPDVSWRWTFRGAGRLVVPCDTSRVGCAVWRWPARTPACSRVCRDICRASRRRVGVWAYAFGMLIDLMRALPCRCSADRPWCKDILERGFAEAEAFW